VIGRRAVVEVTGLRSPCTQLDGFRPGLMKAVLDRDEDGGLVRKAGVMAVVVASGMVGQATRWRSPSRPSRMPSSFLGDGLYFTEI